MIELLRVDFGAVFISEMADSKKPLILLLAAFLYLVGIAGFEPAISCPPDKRLTGLGHIPMFVIQGLALFNEAELYQFAVVSASS